MAKEGQERIVKKYYVDIEGKEHPWDKVTIAVSEIRRLGNLPDRLAVVEEFPNGTERTLADSETVQLKPGYRYGRAPKFKRG